jgi:outer membrane lipoprotein-sorting protein
MRADRKTLAWLFGVALVAAIAVAAYFHYLHPCVIVWRSARTSLRLAHPDGNARGQLELQVELAADQKPHSLRAALAYRQPALFRFDIESSEGNVRGVYNRDLWLYLPAQQTALRARADLPLWEIQDGPTPVSVSAPPLVPPKVKLPAVIPWYAPAVLWWETQITRQGVESVEGVDCDVLEVQPQRHLREKFNGQATVWIGRRDRLPRKVEVVEAGQQWRAVLLIKELELNSVLPESEFVFAVPEQTKQQEVPLEQVRRFLRVLPRFLSEAL